MTEEEARTKVCKREVIRKCMYPNYKTGATEEYEYMEYLVLCIASDCMMFRKHPKYSDSYYCGLGGTS